MTNIQVRNGNPQVLGSHEVRVAVCFWVLVAGLALMVANALAASI